MILLAQGQFAAGWQGYMQRQSLWGSSAPLHRTRLPGDLTSRSILLCRDQGLVDELFFLRFAPELKRRGARLMYQCGAKLLPLVSRLPDFEEVIADGAPLPVADLNLSIGDLPLLLGMSSVDDIPPSLRLTALPTLLERVAARMRAAGPPP